ncbi:MAG: GAF domain-containing sensor histidine kinase [Deltaproteobacteria bacterium]
MNFHKLHDFSELHEQPQLATRLLKSISAIVEVINNRRLLSGRRFTRILEIILDYLGVEQGSIMILSHGRKLVVEAATREELIGQSQPLDGDTISAIVARNGTTEFIKDLSRDSRFKNRPDKKIYRSKSLLSVPIKQDSKVLGVINVTDKCADKDLLKEDATYLLNFASLVLSLIAQEKMLAEIKKQGKSLKGKNLELRRVQVLQAELSKMLIHDIKGPLSEVVANLDILSYSANEEQREFLENAQLACDRAVRMASDLGSVAKIEDRSMKLIRELVEPVELLDEALTSVKGLARIKNVTLRQETPDNLPTVRIDRILVQRVLQNLLINALGYSPTNTEIVVGCSLPAGKKHLLFFVADQGPGISPEEQTIVFEKYARLSASQSMLMGTGLGLYFCKLVVEQHKGHIGVESRENAGSKFFFSLPL